MEFRATVRSCNIGSALTGRSAIRHGTSQAFEPCEFVCFPMKSIGYGISDGGGIGIGVAGGNRRKGTRM